MINIVKNQFLEAQKETNPEIKLRQLKIIEQRIIQIIIDPKSSSVDVQQAKLLVQLLTFSCN